GTRFTMEEDFLKKRLRSYGLKVLVPEPGDREEVNRIIYEELVKGILKSESKKKLIEIIERLVKAGAEGVILGCTELPLLVKEGDVEVPLFDTTRIHAEAVADFILGRFEP
ncbi:MAG: aspartate racemase, partial [Thermoprotei archaeon]